MGFQSMVLWLVMWSFTQNKKLPETNEGRPFLKGLFPIGNTTEPTIDFQGICEFSRVFCNFKVFLVYFVQLN